MPKMCVWFCRISDHAAECATVCLMCSLGSVCMWVDPRFVFFGDDTARKHVFSLDIETVKGSFVIQLGTERMSTTYPSPANAIDKLE